MVSFFAVICRRSSTLTTDKMREIPLSSTESSLDSHEVEMVALKRLLDKSAEARATVADAAK